MEYLCGICQKPVSGESINVCSDCLSDYGLNPKPYDEWPKWARFAMQNEWERRNKQKRDADHEVPYGVFLSE